MCGWVEGGGGGRRRFFGRSACPLPSTRAVLPSARSHPPTLPFPYRSRESASWRSTLTSESAEWRTFVNATIHAMGLAAANGPQGGMTARVDL